jgi:hypothetical protein
VAYDVNGLTTRVQSKLDNTSFDTTKILNFLNDTNRFILNAKRWPFMETTQNFTAVIGTQSIGTLPTNLQVPINLRILTPLQYTVDLPYMPYEEYDRAYPNPSLLPNNPPIFYTIFAGTILLAPTAPDQAYVLQLRYLKKPTALAAGTDVPDVPSEFEELMVLGAYKRALEHEDSFDQAQVVDQEFLEQLNLMNVRMTRRQLGQETRMRSGRSRVGRGGYTGIYYR